MKRRTAARCSNQRAAANPPSQIEEHPMMTEPTTPAPRVTSHTYEGDGGPCAAEAYGQTCGAPRPFHELDEGHAPLMPEREAEIRERKDTLATIAATKDRPLSFEERDALRMRTERLHAELDRVRAERDKWAAHLNATAQGAGRLQNQVERLTAERDRATCAFDALAAKHDKAKAERDELLAELGGRDDEARERWIQKQLDETGIRAMDFRNGITMDIEPARELCAHFVGAARAMLGDAPNYSETKLEFDVKVAESPELYTLVVQRHGPGVLTPHEARQRAEKARAEVLGIVSAWCIEANDVGGVDAGDLAWRLEQAGHPLPDEDADDEEGVDDEEPEDEADDECDSDSDVFDLISEIASRLRDATDEGEYHAVGLIYDLATGRTTVGEARAELAELTFRHI
ncbi:hypothetical protein ACH4TQ_27455 [Streptomyces sp. NPDC021218]|uniref:hypothetical protein n=1 Tax=Streptomyces sp. NPDC021218 TaxID=3365119 RepID=UPI0037945AA7